MEIIVVNEFRDWKLVVEKDGNEVNKIYVLDKNNIEVAPANITPYMRSHLIFPYIMNLIADIASEEEFDESIYDEE